MAYRVIHYINQFFAGIGGEDKADVGPEVREGVVGPGMAFKAALGGEAEIVATFICGDNYFANHMDEVSALVVETVREYKADALIAGPAFNAGRYGAACASVCAAVQNRWSRPCTGKIPAWIFSARKFPLWKPPIPRAAWPRPYRPWPACCSSS